ncbi:MAG TPA: hypothetical protein VGO92_07005, partial [Acidimicrobiales bacterium]|nr:hypothetical protein [Acidimicrobiales bacterium]
MYRRLVGPFVLLVAALAALAAVRPDGAASPAAEARPVEPPRVENELRLANGRAVKSLESPRMLAAADGVRSAVHGAPGDTLLRARLAADSLPVAAGLDAAWKELGPKPYVTDHPDYLATNGESFGVVSGRITSLAVDPTNPDIVFAGAAGGGVWRTADAGDHWTPIGDTLPTMAVGAVALDPNDPHTVFVGTGESNTGGDNIYGSGVYRSHDDGGTWERVAQNIASEATVAHIEVSGDRVFVASSKGLWRSDDKGDTYANVLLPTNAAGTAPDGHFLSNIVSDVKVKPDDPNEVTAAVGWRKGVKSGSTPGALYRSTTGGAPGSFTRMAPTGFGSPSPNAQSTDPVGRVTLAYAKGPQQNPDVLWAVIQDAGVEAGDTFVGSPLPPKYTSLNGVYRSQDDGATWALKATSAELAATPFSALSYRLPLQYGPGIQSWYDQWIAVDPTDENRVLLGLEEIYQSLPGANAPAGLAGWTTVGRYNNLCLIAPCDPTLPGPVLGGITTHPDQHAFAFAPLPGGGVRLYAGNDGGVWRQDAQAVTGFDNEHWTSTNKTMGTTQPYSAVMGGDGTVWLGLQDNGTAKITPTGEGIEANGGDGFDVAVDPKNSDIAFGELPYGDLQKTTDGGKNWSGVAPSVTGAQFDAPIEIDPRDAKHVVFAGKQLFESADGGDTVGASWQQSFDTGYNDAGKANNSITAVGVEGTAVYAGFCGLCDVITDGRGDVTRFHNGLA